MTTKTLCTYAVGSSNYRIMALAMMQTARETSNDSIDRYVIFTDDLNWKSIPHWVELIQISNDCGNEKQANWALKPQVFRHPSVENDLVLFIDADSTVARDVIGKSFQWIDENSLLLYLRFISSEDTWGGKNLQQVYARAGFEAKNLSINSGIVGRKPDDVGRRFQDYWYQWMNAKVLSDCFEDPMYKRNDEPYAGLAYQRAYGDAGCALPNAAHPFRRGDYMLTIGADPAAFFRKPGPVIQLDWSDDEICCPAIVHWVDRTHSLYYRLQLWKCMFRGRLLRAYLPRMLVNDVSIFLHRATRKLGRVIGKTNVEAA